MRVTVRYMLLLSLSCWIELITFWVVILFLIRIYHVESSFQLGENKFENFQKYISYVGPV